MNPYKVYDKTAFRFDHCDDESYVGYDAWEQTWDAEQIDAGTPIFRKNHNIEISDFIAEIMEKLDGLRDEDLDDFVLPSFLS